MTDTHDVLTDYMQVRRIISRICLANEDLSKEERVVLASSVGGASSLSSDQLRVLIEDTADMPDIGLLMKNLTQPSQYRQLLIDIAALAIIKRDWHEDEMTAAKQAIAALPFDDAMLSGLNSTFDTLRKVSDSLG